MAITDIFKPFTEYFAAQTKGAIKNEEYASIVGGELIGALIEAGSDIVFTKFGSKAIQLLGGVALNALAVWGDLDPRTRKDLLEISSHMLFRVVDPTPQEVKELRRSFERFREGLESRNMEMIWEALFRNPAEWQEAISEGCCDIEEGTIVDIPGDSGEGMSKEETYGVPVEVWKEHIYPHAGDHLTVVHYTTPSGKTIVHPGPSEEISEKERGLKELELEEELKKLYSGI